MGHAPSADRQSSLINALRSQAWTWAQRQDEASACEARLRKLKLSGPKDAKNKPKATASGAGPNAPPYVAVPLQHQRVELSTPIPVAHQVPMRHQYGYGEEQVQWAPPAPPVPPSFHHPTSDYMSSPIYSAHSSSSLPQMPAQAPLYGPPLPADVVNHVVQPGGPSVEGLLEDFLRGQDMAGHWAHPDPSSSPSVPRGSRSEAPQFALNYPPQQVIPPQQYPYAPCPPQTPQRPSPPGERGEFDWQAMEDLLTANLDVPGGAQPHLPVPDPPQPPWR